MKNVKRILEGKKNNKKSYKKHIAVATLAVAMIGTTVAVPIMATTNPTMYKIATTLGIEKDLSSYESIVGKSITKDGITLTVNEVIVNNDKILVSVTSTSDEDISKTFSGVGGRVYINGEEMNMGSTGTFKLSDKNTGHTFITIPMSKKFEGELSVKLVLTDSLMMTDKGRVPHCVYEFKANGDELRADTQTVELNKTFETAEGDKVKLGLYEGNSISHTIDVEIESMAKDISRVYVKGVDEKGNEIKFYAPILSNGKGELVVEEDYLKIANEAKSMKLGLYIDDKQVGESFDIIK